MNKQKRLVVIDQYLKFIQNIGPDDPTWTSGEQILVEIDRLDKFILIDLYGGKRTFSLTSSGV